jgi:arylsulfatase A-like enzyme
VHVPAYHPHAPRSGDHTPHSRCWASGNGIDPRAASAGGHVCDIAATVLALLEVPLPSDLDGAPLLEQPAARGTREEGIAAAVS